jgi:hypothetical protein
MPFNIMLVTQMERGDAAYVLDVPFSNTALEMEMK